MNLWLNHARSWALSLVTALTCLTVGAAAPQPPEIKGITVDRLGVRVSVLVPDGVQRVVLESTERGGVGGWVPRAVRRLDGTRQTLVIDLPSAAPHELLRVRADENDPLPAAFYSGRTNITPLPLANGGQMVIRGGGQIDFLTAAPTSNPPTVNDGAARTVVESDIWKVRGNRLYFFNQLRGLQSIDVTEPDAPKLLGTLPFPAAGEQIYVPDDGHVVLLLREDCRGNGYEGAAIVVVDVTGTQPGEVARLPVAGRLFESRMVGNALYVASQTYDQTDATTGVWQLSTVVSSFDLGNPAAPVARGSRKVAGTAAVVAAADSFFFVGLDVPRAGGGRSTELHVLDVLAADGTVTEFAKIPLSGWIRDKFKIHLRGDVLHLLVEDQQQADRWSPITRLTTWRLARDGAKNFSALGKLDLSAGENLFGTRFDGDRAYVVTYRRVDPLWIVDLSDPTQPRIQGELKIPGWSNYLLPMGDRLLTVGIDDEAGWRAAVQLFDVTDPAKPSLLSKIPLGDKWSWSEANSDEKALGVFPEDGLVLIPFSSSGQPSVRQGVQIIDFARDSLKARGLIEHPTFVPRRSALVGSRVLSLSAGELLTADITERDAPKVTARLELSHPVDRVVATHGHLLTFGDTGVSVATKATPDATLSRMDLGKLPVLGTTVRDDLLYLLQGTAAQVLWIQPNQDADWVPSTNSGLYQLRILSLAALPKLVEVGVTESKHQDPSPADLAGYWPTATTLVWTARGALGGYYPGWLSFTARPGGAVAIDGGGVVFANDQFVPSLSVMPVESRFFMPWRGWGQSRTLAAVDVADPAQPRFRASISANPAAVATSEVFRGDGLLYFTEEYQESTVLGTNVVIWTESFYETVQNPTKPGATDPVIGTRPVTNFVPIVQWWQRHELRVVDYRGGAVEPVVRPALAFPGELRGLSHDGNVLFSLARRSEGKTDVTTRELLEVSAYDGVSVFVGDSLTLSTNGVENVSIHVTRDGRVALARGSWSVPERNVLHVLALENARFKQLAEVKLAAQPQECVLQDDILFVRESGGLRLWDLATPAAPKSIPAVDHGCIWFDLRAATGSREDGWWISAGEYGVLRLGAPL